MPESETDLIPVLNSVAFLSSRLRVASDARPESRIRNRYPLPTCPNLPKNLTCP